MSNYDATQIDNGLEHWLASEPNLAAEWRKIKLPRHRLRVKRLTLETAEALWEKAEIEGRVVGHEELADQVVDLVCSDVVVVESVLTIIAFAVLSEIIRWIVKKLLERWERRREVS